MVLSELQNHNNNLANKNLTVQWMWNVQSEFTNSKSAFLMMFLDENQKAKQKM